MIGYQSSNGWSLTPLFRNNKYGILCLRSQEVVLYCGRLIGTNPDMFRGILKIRVGWVLEAIRSYLQLFPEQKRTALEDLSPYRLRTLLQRILTVSDWAEERGSVSSYFLKTRLVNLF